MFRPLLVATLLVGVAAMLLVGAVWFILPKFAATRKGFLQHDPVVWWAGY